MTIASSTKLQINWVNTLFFVGLHIGALFAFVSGNFSWSAVGVAVLLYWVSGGLGVTLGFHRLVTHRSFQTPKWLEYFLVFCGTLACQGGPIEWIGTHRIHHLHSDTEADPHDSNKGFWWSHMGWLIYQCPAHAEIPRFTKDIAEDRVYQFLEKNFILELTHCQKIDIMQLIPTSVITRGSLIFSGVRKKKYTERSIAKND